CYSNWTQRYIAFKKMSFLQMIRRLCVPMSRCAHFIGPVALALFTSAAVVFAWTTISSISAAPLGKEQDRVRIVAQIRSILSAQQEAWNRGDIDGFMNGYARSRSTIFVSEDTVTRGWQTVRDRYKKKYSDRAEMGTIGIFFLDRKSTRLNSSHVKISYAVFC